MRLLHAGFRDEPVRAAPPARRRSCGPHAPRCARFAAPRGGWPRLGAARRRGRLARRGAARAVGQPVPLHRLPADSGRRADHAPLARRAAGRSGVASKTGAARARWAGARGRFGGKLLRHAAHAGRAAGAACCAPAGAAGRRHHRRGAVGHQAAPALRADHRPHPRGRTAAHRARRRHAAHRRRRHAGRRLRRAGAGSAAARPLPRPLRRPAGTRQRHAGRQRGQRLAHRRQHAAAHCPGRHAGAGQHAR